MKSDENNLSGWHKFQIISNSLFIPILIAVLGYWFSDAIKQKEIAHSDISQNRAIKSSEKISEQERSVQYLGIAIDVLSKKPDESNKQLRKWAIAILKKYSPVAISAKVEEELENKTINSELILSIGKTQALVHDTPIYQGGGIGNRRIGDGPIGN